MRFDAVEAAIEGMRVARREPLALGLWAIFMVVFSFLSMIITLGMFPGLITEMQGAETSGDPTVALGLLGQMAQMYVILIPLYLAFYSIFYCAVYRAVLRPKDKGFGYLRLGGDELRMIGLMLYQFVVWVGISLAVSIVLFFVIFVLAMALGGSVLAGAELDASAGIGVFLMVIALYLVLFAAFIFFAIRLSLAAPATFAEKRIRLFSTWSMTKGQFWPLLGCYLLAIVIGLIVSLLGSAISLVGLVAFGEFTSFTDILEPNMSSLQAYFTPGRIVMLLISTLISTLAYVVFVAPAAAAYRDITAKDDVTA